MTKLKICATIGLTVILTATPLFAGKPLNEPIKPIPATVDIDPKIITLGRKLFHDVRLSKGETVSCASCHDLTHGGVDGAKVSTGINGKQGVINSPTVYNTGYLFRLFWDGRAESLEDQVDGPIQNPVEMGSLWADIVAKLYEDPDYPGMFKDTFGSGISRQNIKSSLAGFQRSLTTPNSRFDQYLLGDENAITALEKTGYKNFKSYGCISCHQGAAVGGNMFQLFGVANSYFQNRGNITKADMGRFNVTGNVLDKHTFKVPSLRLAALTAPYLHDGNAPTLRAAVDIMFKFQLGREAPDEDKDAIVAFIKTLAGEHPEMKK